MFQSTLPRGERPRSRRICWRLSVSSIHAPRVGSDDGKSILIASYRVSIHAPRVGSDLICTRTFLAAFGFNPRSPRGERRLTAPEYSVVPAFQSTLPAGERRISTPGARSVNPVSIHAPRVGAILTLLFDWTVFVSIHAPAWGATRSPLLRMGSLSVSIHAPRVGSDGRCKPVRCSTFHSTLPAWGATSKSVPLDVAVRFQSTLPAWGATMQLSGAPPKIVVSIHAPAWGATASPMA